MIYSIEIGKFMVRKAFLDKTPTGYHLREVHLSKEIQAGFDKETAEIIAKLTNGKVIEVAEEVTNGE